MEQVEERYISLLTDKNLYKLSQYEASKKAYRDIKNSVDTAKREGIAEGMEKGMKQGMEKGMKQGLEQRSLEIARKMLAKGMDAASVMEITGLSVEQMQQLKADFRW